ncbi:MAG: hypothetical protein MI922_13435, partial [Bacteroidales bacterium]|nr:hypothetical protein [Bacteroidales bacterium]
MKHSLLMIAFIALSISASATKYYVSSSGKDNNDGSFGNPFATIGHAVSQTVSSDTVVIGAGVFTEHSINVDSSITIEGLSAKYTIIQADTVKPNNTISNMVFFIHADVNMSKLTVRYGSPGIKIGFAGSLNIQDCNIIDCYTETAGCGVYAVGNLTMNRCCVANNTSTKSGAGIFATRSVDDLSEVIISNSTISNNMSTGANAYGGGICITNGTLELQNSTVAYNSATAKGKGIHMNSDVAWVKVFTNNIIAANGKPDVGANKANLFSDTADIDYNVISHAFNGFINFGDNTVFNSSNNNDD